jgi:hypothetical protein
MFSCSDKRDLFLNFSEAVGYSCLIILTAWDKGVQWSYVQKETVEQCDWLNNPNLPLPLLVNDHNAQAWVESIPSELILPLLEFEILYPNLIFPAMWFLSRYPRSIDLLLSYPLLLALILYRAQIETWNEETITRLFSAKRTHIFAACGLHGTKGNVRLLKKLTFAHFGLKEYKILLKNQSLPAYTELRRLDYLDFLLLEYLNISPNFTLSHLFRKYDSKWPWREFRRLHADILRMAKQLDIQNIHDMIFSCRGIDALSHLHDRLVIRINMKEADSLPIIHFPPPPSKGNNSIIPITNSSELRLEGKMQHHCVASYHREIKTKQYYVYKVLEPERATLGVRIRVGDKMEVDQLKLRYNAEPSNHTKNLITNWIIEENRNYHALSIMDHSIQTTV